jgi:hypothetical protein
MPRLADPEDQGRRRREQNRDNHRRRQRQARQDALALQRERREEALNAPEEVEKMEKMEQLLRAEFQDEEVTELSEIPRISAVIILGVILGQTSVLSEKIAISNARRYFRLIREKLENGFNWNNEDGAHFVPHHDQRFEPTSASYIYHHDLHDADGNFHFIRRFMKKAAFQLNNHEIVTTIYDMIDRRIKLHVDPKVLIYRWNQMIPKAIIRAAFSQYFCADCGCLLIDKRELKRHMMLKHRNDVKTQHRRRAAEENEEELLLRIVKRSKLKRHIFGSLNNAEIAESFRCADRMTWTLHNDEAGTMNEFQIETQEPTELRF